MKFPARLLACSLLILFAATAAVAQTPTSGAMLTIKDSGGTILVQIYDSQIHSGTVLAVPLLGGSPACAAGDQSFPTDAYVLQGGSATGCDATDSFEVTDLATGAATFTPRSDNVTHQLPGQVNIGGFHIETHYICAGACAPPTPTPQYTQGFCNSSQTICTSAGGPDTGFLIVRNDTGAQFNGTITLQGNSPLAGAPFCPTNTDVHGNGVAFDSSSSSLDPGASVTLALGTQGSDGAGTSDSSNCGGFNFDQVSASMASSTQATTFIFGKDKFTVTPSNINTGDILTFRPVPVPAGQFNKPGTMLTGSPQGNGSQCVSIADFAAPTGANVPNAVCPEFQTHCFKSDAHGNPTTTFCADAPTFFWTGEFDAHLDPNAGYPLVNGVPEVGGVHFLGAPGVNCAQNSFSEDIVSAYTGDSPGDLPLKSGGSGLNCFVTSFDASAAPIAQGVTVTPFTGFSSPVSDTQMNVVQLGRTVPLKFQLTNGAGGSPVTNLSLCGSLPCTGVPTPWIFLGVSTLSCAAAAADTSGTNFAADDTPITGANFQNLGGGNYLFSWKIPKSSTFLNTCAAVNVTLNNGLVLLDVASFKFGNQ